MPEPREAEDLVRRDVEEGIGSWLLADESVEGAGFRLLEDLGLEDGHLTNSDAGTVAIPWGYRGRHERDVMGLLPTGRIIDIKGVTLVHETSDGPRFSRFVDWIGALGQMGVGLFSRPVLDDPPNAGLRRRVLRARQPG